MIETFRGENAFLSNFYKLDRPIVYGWMVGRTSEHLFCALKTTDINQRIWILDADTAQAAKSRGRSVQLREGWEFGLDEKAMHLALMLKFTANNDLLVRLLITRDKHLVEGNYWHDNNWGNCTCDNCLDKPGLNRLGNMLMMMRQLFQHIG